jgi:hypothetical protein
MKLETVDFLLQTVERMVVRPCLENSEEDFRQIRDAHDALLEQKMGLQSQPPATGFWKISNSQEKLQESLDNLRQYQRG